MMSCVNMQRGFPDGIGILSWLTMLWCSPGRTCVTNASGHPTKFNRWDLNTAAQVDMERIIANEMKMIASSGYHLARYIERHCMSRQARVRNAHAPPAQQHVFDERVTCWYTWDMLEANQRAFMFMHDSMHQLQLKIRGPHVDHSLGTRDEFRTHADWPEGRPFQ
ncbi:hypothetical protein KIW84_020140 [Lathyrus oleraceus]|uniref:Uncharacterized protein n=1 Tax=Pisum sativum TaxID=3888 RepID=A0A9D4Y6E7_PEA|nr:hypothetical protein KIW84_020140 [Pisum sativum]